MPAQTNFAFLFVLLLSSYGLTIIITESYLFKPLRKLLYRYSPRFLGKLVYCCICTGFWAGALTSGLSSFVFEGHLSSASVLEMFLIGWASSGLNWFLHVLIFALGVTDVTPEADLNG